MVFAILVETTSPIRSLRRPCAFSVVVAVVVVVPVDVSVMAYFFSVAAVLLAAFFAFTTLGAFTAFGALAAFATGATAFTLTEPLPPANCFSRSMVLMRAMSFFKSRIFFRLSVWPRSEERRVGEE